MRLDSVLSVATVAGTTQTVSGAVSGGGGLRLNPAASGGGNLWRNLLVLEQEARERFIAATGSNFPTLC